MPLEVLHVNAHCSFCLSAPLLTVPSWKQLNSRQKARGGVFVLLNVVTMEQLKPELLTGT